MSNVKAAALEADGAQGEKANKTGKSSLTPTYRAKQFPNDFYASGEKSVL